MRIIVVLSYHTQHNCVVPFLAVQDSSIGDVVSQWVSDLPFDFSVFRALYNCDYNDYNGYNDYNDYNDYRDSDLDLDWERFSELVT